MQQNGEHGKGGRHARLAVVGVNRVGLGVVQAQWTGLITGNVKETTRKKLFVTCKHVEVFVHTWYNELIHSAVTVCWENIVFVNYTKVI